MSNENMNEKQVLEKLGIDNFRQMSKDKISTFTSSLSEMAPEVAKKALEQVPNFVDLSKQVIVSLKDSLNSLMEHNSESEAHVYEGYKRVLKAQENRLNQDDGDLTEEEKNSIIQEMTKIVNKMSDKDTEQKTFNTRVWGTLATVGLTAAALVAIVLGGKNKGKGS